MTRNQSHCSYQYESLSETDPIDIGPLPVADPNRCPHPPASSDDERCLFHTTEGESPSSVVADAVLEAISDPDQEATFAGGRTGNLDLSGTILQTPNGEPIDLRGVTIDGDLNLSETVIKAPLLLGNAAITGKIDARGAHFEEIVNVAGTNVGRQALLARSQFDAGIVANGLDAGFVDARALSVDGPAVFDDASFSANVRFARSQFNGELSCTNAQWRLLADFAMISVADEASFDESDVGGEFRLTGASFEQGLSIADIEIGGDTCCSHTTITGSLDASGARFSGEADFDDIRCSGGRALFDEVVFEAATTFSFAEIAGPLSFIASVFEDEVWFTYGYFGRTVSFEEARFEDLTHLRDATFAHDVVLRSVTSTSQLFLHGSTIGGNVDFREATLDHFQFGADLEGDADFRSVRFDAQAMFARSQFSGVARFDSASFAGDPDFTACQFSAETSFEDTEFLVSPTFEDAEFAVEPNLAAADDSRAISAPDGQGPLIVARPEDLSNTGVSVPLDDVTGDLIIPAEVAGLLEADSPRAKAIRGSLIEVDRATWYGLFDDCVKLARTAAFELEPTEETPGVYVFGFSIDREAEEPERLLEDVSLVAAYWVNERERQIEFSHLATDVARIDHLVSVPGDASVFGSDVPVATHTEFRRGLARRLMHQAVLHEQEGSERSILQDSLPAIVGISQLEFL